MKIFSELIENLKWTITCRYSFFEKLSIFNILTALSIKSKFLEGKSNKTQKIFQFRVSTYSYRILRYLFFETFISYEYGFTTENKSPKIIDCGANIGMATLFFKRVYPKAEILCFEPNPDSFALLEKNIRVNDLLNVNCYNYALSNVEGTLDFFTSNDKGTLRGSFIKERGGLNHIKVKSELLSNYIGHENFELIKIDVEGAETEVIDNLIKTDRLRNSNFFIIEYHHNILGKSDGLSSFIESFENFGYKYNIKTNFNVIGQYQDVLLYFYKTSEL